MTENKMVTLYFKKIKVMDDFDYLTCFNKNIDNYISGKYNASHELVIDGVNYYISGLKRDTDSFGAELVRNENQNISVKPYMVAITLSKVDTSSDVSFADVSKSINDRTQQVLVDGKPVSDDKNTGPVIATNVLIDPFRGFMLGSRLNNGITMNAIGKFLGHLFGDVVISFSLVPDMKDINDFEKLNVVSEISYAIAYPDKMESFINNGSSETKDIDFANEMEGEELIIKLKSPSKIKTKQKIANLLKRENKLKSLTINGTNDEGAQTIDLIKNKLKTTGTINYEKGKVISQEKFIDMLLFEYKENYDTLKKLYNIELTRGFVDENRKAKKE